MMTDIYIWIIQFFLLAIPLWLMSAALLLLQRTGILWLGVDGQLLFFGSIGLAMIHSGFNHNSILLLLLFFGLLGGMFWLLFTHVLKISELTLTILWLALGVGVNQIFSISPLTEKSWLIVMQPISFDTYALLNFTSIYIWSIIGIVSLPCLYLFFNKSNWGMICRAVGDNAKLAKELGYKVTLWRLAALSIASIMISLMIYFLLISAERLNNQWLENPYRIFGYGWLCMLLLVISAWRPIWLIIITTLLSIFQLLLMKYIGVSLWVWYGITFILLLVVSFKQPYYWRYAPTCWRNSFLYRQR